MKIFAIIVTYSDRFHFLETTIQSSFDEGVDKIIIVDNNSVNSSKHQLQELEAKEDRLKVIYLNENTGSSGGFKSGLKEAYNNTECEFIWLLDDDNKPKHNSLKNLIDQWNKFSNVNNKDENLSLLSYRPDRIAYKNAILKNNPNYILGRKNSFLGFHFLDFPYKLVKLFRKKIGMENPKKNNYIPFGKVAVAPYGGMFFHKKLVSKIGYPNEDFFVYADDYDWSYRIKNIYLLLNSEIEDIDTSWNLKETPSSPFYSFLNYGSNFRVYYSVRNRVFFDKQLLKNTLMYKINKFLYMFAMFLFSNKSNKERYLLFKKAVYEGEMGKLGNTFNNGAKKS